MTRRSGSAEDRAVARRRLEPEPLLNAVVKHQVEFVVVGGYAVAAHGFPRATKDIDICPEPSDRNLQHLADALADLEAEPIGVEEFAENEFDLEPDLEGLKMGGNWVLLTKHGRLDVMQHLDGLGREGGGWKELRPHAVTRTFLGHNCLFCSYEDLLRMKSAADREQDRVDLATLRALRNEQPRT
jgi:hypothetical protein